jgi:hypothetical protein
VRKSFANIFFCKEIGFFSKLNCYWFFCRYFVFALVTLVALLASPIILWLDPWVWGFPTIFFLVSANVAVVVYLYFTILSYIFLLFRWAGGTRQPARQGPAAERCGRPCFGPAAA